MNATENAAQALERNVDDAQLRGCAEMDTQADRSWPTEHLESLTTKLQGLKLLQERDFRDELIAGLDPRIVALIPRKERAGDDVGAIVDTCALYEGGIEALIASVCKLTPGMIWRRDFDAWLKTFGWTVSEAQTVPYVVAAMTQAEALMLPKIITDAEEHKRYDMFEEKLRQSGVHLSELKARYGETREEWRPQLATEDGEVQAEGGAQNLYHSHTINNIVNDFFHEFNEHLHAQGLRAVQPETFTDRLFPPHSVAVSSEPLHRTDTIADHRAQMRTRMQAANELKKGCILFVDPLSLFHPTILTGLKDAEIISKSDRVAILLLTPASSYSVQVNWLMNDAIGRFIPYTLLRRAPEDALYECGVDGIYFLKRRLAAFLQGAQPIPWGRGPAPESEQVFGRAGARGTKIAAYIPGVRGAL